MMMNDNYRLICKNIFPLIYNSLDLIDIFYK